MAEPKVERIGGLPPLPARAGVTVEALPTATKRLQTKDYGSKPESVWSFFGS